MSTVDNPQVMGDASPNQIILRYGLIGGLITIVSALLGIITGYSSPANGFGGMILNAVIALAIYVVVMVLAVKDHREKNLGGIINFGGGFKVAFLTGLVVAIVGTIFNYLYFNVIDPGYLETMVADMEALYEKMGMDQEQIDQALAQMESGFKGMGMLKNFGFGAIAGAVVSLIIAAIMKKDPPETVM